MATLAPPSPAKPATTTGEHREGELLLLLFILLTFNSALVMYILRGDVVSVASAGATYVAVGLLLARLFGRWEVRPRQLDAIIWILFLLLGVVQVSRLLARTPTASLTSVPVLVGVAGATALGLGGCCAYMLHRRSWSKQQRQQAIFLPHRQDPRS